jgi:hypothetical protein
MRNVIIALGVALMVLFAGSALAADQTRTRSKDQIRSTYQKGTKDQTRTRDQQKSQRSRKGWFQQDHEMTIAKLSEERQH